MCGWKNVSKYVKCCLKTENCCLKTLTKHPLIRIAQKLFRTDIPIGFHTAQIAKEGSW